MTDEEGSAPGSAVAEPIAQTAPEGVGNNWLDDVTLAVKKAGDAAAGQGFSLDPEAAEAVLKQAYDLEDHITRLLDTNSRLEQIMPPADDAASNFYHGHLMWNDKPGAFVHGLGHLRVEKQYVSALIERLQLALEKTRGADERSASETKQATEAEEGFLG